MQLSFGPTRKEPSIHFRHKDVTSSLFQTEFISKSLPSGNQRSQFRKIPCNPMGVSIGTGYSLLPRGVHRSSTTAPVAMGTGRRARLVAAVLAVAEVVVDGGGWEPGGPWKGRLQRGWSRGELPIDQIGPKKRKITQASCMV